MLWVYGGMGLLFLRFLFFLTGSWRSQRQEQRYYTQSRTWYHPRVSVIIPARNEEQYIEQCIDSIFANAYENFEVIVVDDQSEDRTPQIVRALQRRYGSQLRVVSTHDTTIPLAGKARALAVGIQHAQGEIFLFTDADCRVQPTWIDTMVQPFADPAIGCVASFSSMVATRWFERLQQIEWLYNHTLARAALGWNVALGCFGNNLAVRRQAYERTGGLEQIPYSLLTEDLALLLAIKQESYRCLYVRSPDSYVQTYPLQTFTAYLRQHHRWVHGGTALGWKAVVFMLATIGYWSAIAVSLGIIPAVTPILVIVRWGLDLALLLPTVIQLREFIRILPLSAYLVPVLLVFQILELSLPLFLLSRRIYWKDREIIS